MEANIVTRLLIGSKIFKTICFAVWSEMEIFNTAKKKNEIAGKLSTFMGA